MDFLAFGALVLAGCSPSSVKSESTIKMLSPGSFELTCKRSLSHSTMDHSLIPKRAAEWGSAFCSNPPVKMETKSLIVTRSKGLDTTESTSSINCGDAISLDPEIDAEEICALILAKISKFDQRSL